MRSQLEERTLRIKGRQVSLSKQDRKFLTMMAVGFGLLAVVVILDQLGVI